MLKQSWENPILDRFIVFEGIDGSGTTTQAKRLTAYLNRNSTHTAEFTFEPTDRPIGTTIRALLNDPVGAHPWTLALLFAADRNEHLEHSETGICSTIARGVTVVCDRYLFSSLAYQGALAAFDEVETLNCRFPLPKTLFFIDTPIATAQERMRSREALDLLEGDAVQTRVEAMYRTVIKEFSKRYPSMVHIIDGSQDEETVFRRIVSVLDRL